MVALREYKNKLNLEGLDQSDRTSVNILKSPHENSIIASFNSKDKRIRISMSPTNIQDGRSSVTSVGTRIVNTKVNNKSEHRQPVSSELSSPQAKSRYFFARKALLLPPDINLERISPKPKTETHKKLSKSISAYINER